MARERRAGVIEWIGREVADRGRLPLLFFLLGFLVAFLLIRLSTRMIRAQVRWWPGNITPNGHHVHHVVFGVVVMVISGGAMITAYESASRLVGIVCATFFGIGTALVLDEFALIFYLDDVYWSEQGRVSVDAVFVAVAVTGLLLLGLQPLVLVGLGDIDGHQGRLLGATIAVASLALAAVVLLKGKIWTGLVGLFFPPLLVVGAVRLSRPASPWARWFYTGRPRRMSRAIGRERRYRRPIIRTKIFVQDMIAGKPTMADVLESIEHAKVATEAELSRTVQSAPAPISGRGSESGTIEGLPHRGTSI